MDKINIVLSPSQQSWNKCIMGDTEQNHCYEIAKKIADKLRGYNSNVCLIPKLNGDENFTLSEVVRISNEFIAKNGGKGYHLDIHTDGGYKGKGASGFYLSEGGKAFILRIWQEISNITPWGDGGISSRDLYVLRETTAIAGLLEISFHDDITQAKWIHQNMDLIADKIIKGMEITTGIVKIPQQEHWAETHWKYLNDNGVKIVDKRFDEPATRGEVMAMLANAYAHFDR